MFTENMLNREPTWNENLGFLIVSFAIASGAATLVPTAGLGGLPGAVGVIMVFVIIFFNLYAGDRPVVPPRGVITSGTANSQFSSTGCFSRDYV